MLSENNISNIVFIKKNCGPNIICHETFIPNPVTVAVLKSLVTYDFWCANFFGKYNVADVIFTQHSIILISLMEININILRKG